MVLDTVKHYPVLLNELISIITPQHGGTFIDCTFGQGGYSRKILSYKNTQIIAIDRDIESKKKADKIIKEFEGRLIFKNKKFSELLNLKLKNENIKSVIFDLGYSYTQIKDPKKGLSFNSDNQSSDTEDLLGASEDDHEEDDLEIPAFLRRQKN